MATVLIPDALTTLENVKLFINQTTFSTQEDDLLRLLINSCSEYIQNTYIGRSLRSQEYVDFIEGTQQPYLVLDNRPITAITSIQIDDDVLLATDYDQTPDRDLRAGMIYLNNSLWRQKFIVLGLVDDPFRQLKNIKVTYTAGYILPSDSVNRTLPYDIETLVARKVTGIFERTQTGSTEGLSRLTEGALTYEWNTDLVPEDIRVLDAYRGVI